MPMLLHFQPVDEGYKGMLVVRSELKSVVPPTQSWRCCIHWYNCLDTLIGLSGTQELHNGVQDVVHYKKNLTMTLP